MYVRPFIWAISELRGAPSAGYPPVSSAVALTTVSVEPRLDRSMRTVCMPSSSMPAITEYSLPSITAVAAELAPPK